MSNNDFLFEIGVEELPTQALLPLAKALEKNIIDALEGEKIAFNSSKYFATPRRLAVIIQGIAEKQAVQVIERQGPAVEAAFDKSGTPTLACMGFAKSCGITADQLQVKKTDKGDRVYCRVEKSGELTVNLLPTLINTALEKLPIAKPMRWAGHQTTFARPVHWILGLLGDQMLSFEKYNTASANKTFGHRFHSPNPLAINKVSDYESELEKNHVIADFEKRRQKIIGLIKKQESIYDITVVIDENLLNEVTALVEWPVVLVGKYHKDFLKVPPEVLITSMKVHQKCFPVTDKNGKLQPFFVLVSNIDSKDPNAIISGNERVINARLSDAAFFFNNDLAKPLNYFNEKLRHVVFQKALGTQFDRIKRLTNISEKIAKQLEENTADAKEAASLSKFDLVSEMVGEFPELQGVMGCYYAAHAKKSTSIANPIKEHYYPRYSGDRLPNDRLSATVALADRLDVLCGIFGINKIPSGEKDPYGLRRAAQGIVRILVEKNLPLDILELLKITAANYGDILPNREIIDPLFQFIMERMRFWYLEMGFSNEVFSAVNAKKPTILSDFHQRLNAVKAFQNLSESESLAAANKRVNNLLKKVSHSNASLAVNEKLLQTASEQNLARIIHEKGKVIDTLYQKKNYPQTLTELASLKAPVDDFFDNVMVMVDSDELRNNRLALLSHLHRLLTQVADISLL